MPHKDPVVAASYRREWKRRNRHRYKTQESNYSRVRNANRRAAEHGVEGRITVEIVERVMAPGVCHYCGGAGNRLGMDHVIPLHAGGPNTEANLVCSCNRCNASKWRGDEPWTWAREHEACVDCATTEKPHRCHGRCSSCYARHRSRATRAARARVADASD